MAEGCKSCEEQRAARMAQEMLPIISSGGVCARCHGMHGYGVKQLGDRIHVCVDPQCGFHWQECVGCSA